MAVVWEVSADLGTGYNAAPELLVGIGKTVSASLGTAFNATPELSGRNVQVSTSIGTSFHATPELYGRNASISVQLGTSFRAVPSLSGKNEAVSAQLGTSFRASPNLTGASDTHGMSVCGVIHEIVMLWGIDCYKTAPGFAIERAINDLNGALQMMWNQARESSYWTNETLTLRLVKEESSKDLDDDIQNVTGQCRRANTLRQLTRLDTLGELETFSEIYLDGETADEPLAYHIERLGQAGSDPARCVFHVTPEVREDYIDFLLEVVREAPRYTADDLAACPVIPIPHRYIETLLLPIARYRASGFTMLFRDKDRQEVIDREYHEARVALGLADPLPGKANTPEREPTRK